MRSKDHCLEITLAGRASVERACSFCQNKWTETINIAGKGSEFTFDRVPKEQDALKVKERARKDLALEEKRAKKQVDRGVLCPCCQHFSTGAMAKHFPRGFRTGLGKKLHKALMSSLFVAIILGPLGILLGGAVLSEEWNKVHIWARIGAGVWALGLIGYSATSMARGYRIMRGFQRVKKFLRAKCEDELLEIVVTHYKRKGNSLSGVFHWAEMLLKLRPLPDRKA